MYRILKASGRGANVIVENTDTKANIIIGKINTNIVDILDANGYTDEYGMISSEWNMEVNRDTAIALSKLAMQMKKPIRDQRRVNVPEAKKDNKKIDAMDVLLGLANYN